MCTGTVILGMGASRLPWRYFRVTSGLTDSGSLGYVPMDHFKARIQIEQLSPGLFLTLTVYILNTGGQMSAGAYLSF